MPKFRNSVSDPDLVMDQSAAYFQVLCPLTQLDGPIIRERVARLVLDINTQAHATLSTKSDFKPGNR